MLLSNFYHNKMFFLLFCTNFLNNKFLTAHNLLFRDDQNWELNPNCR